MGSRLNGQLSTNGAANERAAVKWNGRVERGPRLFCGGTTHVLKIIDVNGGGGGA